MVKKYIPKQKDIVYLNFGPTKGHEQSGIRPAIVVSSDFFNLKTNMAVVCPISSNTKFFPTHYVLNDTNKIKGAVFCEHIRSIDYDERKIKYVEQCSDEDFMNIIFLLRSFTE